MYCIVRRTAQWQDGERCSEQSVVDGRGSLSAPVTAPQTRKFSGGSWFLDLRLCVNERRYQGDNCVARRLLLRDCGGLVGWLVG